MRKTLILTLTGTAVAVVLTASMSGCLAEDPGTVTSHGPVGKGWYEVCVKYDKTGETACSRQENLETYTRCARGARWPQCAGREPR